MIILYSEYFPQGPLDKTLENGDEKLAVLKPDRDYN